MNAGRLVEKISTVIIDHHPIRAKGWREASNMIFETAKKMGHKVVTAAGFIGEMDNTLESRRKALYKYNPPSDAFQKWIALPDEKRRFEKPPIRQCDKIT